MSRSDVQSLYAYTNCGIDVSKVTDMYISVIFNHYDFTDFRLLSLAESGTFHQCCSTRACYTSAFSILHDLLLSSILYTNSHLDMYPSAREAMTKKTNISCV